MLQMFRNLTKSKVGVGITLAFLALMALAFVGGDLANSSFFGGVAGGYRRATGGGRDWPSDLNVKVFVRARWGDTQ